MKIPFFEINKNKITFATFRSCSRVARQSSAKASTPVRIRSRPLQVFFIYLKNTIFIKALTLVGAFLF